MSKTICDTNIWYGVAKGKTPNFFNYDMPIPLIYNNIDEVSMTPKLITNFDFVRATIIAMHRHRLRGEEVIIHNPIHYLIRLDSKNYDSKFGPNYFGILDRFAKIADGVLTKSHFGSQEFIKEAEGRKEELKKFAEAFMVEMKLLKKNTLDRIRRNEISKKDIWSGDLSKDAQEIAKNIISFTSLTGYQISNSFNWNQVELFIKVLEMLLKEFIMTGLVFKANDWYDLTNLIYVAQGDKYCTEDEKWLRIIKSAGMGHYLA